MRNIAGPDDGVFPDGNAGQYDGTGPDPDIFFYMDGQVILGLLIPQPGVHRMGAGGKDHVGADHHMVADEDFAVVHQSQVEIGVNAVPQMDVPPAPVGVKGRLQIAAFADFGKHFF